MKYIVILLILLGFGISCSSIKIESNYKGYSNQGAHARGLDCEGDVVIVSGYNGAYAKIDLANLNWVLRDSINGIEDFRDVKILNDSTFILINSGLNGDVWKVEGDNKKVVYHKENMFLDGIDFDATGQNGYIYGDPIDSTFVVLKSVDFGNSWQRISNVVLPKPLIDEAGFAASGTGIICLSKDVVIFVTGSGTNSRVIKSIDGGETWLAFETPMKSGGSYGIYSTSFIDEQNGVITGGSYKDSTYKDSICFIKTKNTNGWKNISKGLPGYMSCVSTNSDMSLIIVTGRSGTFYSIDKGNHWKELVKTPYYSCFVTDEKIILSGKKGTFEVFNYKL
jgi:hypothetical protein